MTAGQERSDWMSKMTTVDHSGVRWKLHCQPLAIEQILSNWGGPILRQVFLLLLMLMSIVGLDFDIFIFLLGRYWFWTSLFSSYFLTSALSSDCSSLSLSPCLFVWLCCVCVYKRVLVSSLSLLPWKLDLWLSTVSINKQCEATPTCFLLFLKWMHYAFQFQFLKKYLKFFSFFEK